MIRKNIWYIVLVVVLLVIISLIGLVYQRNFSSNFERLSSDTKNNTIQINYNVEKVLSDTGEKYLGDLEVNLILKTMGIERDMVSKPLGKFTNVEDIFKLYNKDYTSYYNTMENHLKNPKTPITAWNKLTHTDISIEYLFDATTDKVVLAIYILNSEGTIEKVGLHSKQLGKLEIEQAFNDLKGGDKSEK